MLNTETMEEQKQAILKAHGVTACHVETVRVSEVIMKHPVWNGDVEVYEITGHPKAKRCYAWTKGTTVTILEIPPVDSPKAAVRSVIVAYLKDFNTRKP